MTGGLKHCAQDTVVESCANQGMRRHMTEKGKNHRRRRELAHTRGEGEG